MSWKVKKQLLPYALVVMLGYVGFSLPLPVLPSLFLSPESTFLPAGMALSTKTILLGLVLAAYPFGQFVGSPILGRLSDRFGRKRVIVASLGGTALGFVIAALGVQLETLGVIFLGLCLCGLCEGNVSIAQSAIADLTPKEERGRYFGYLNFFVTAGFMLGPLIGGILSDAKWLFIPSYSASFWAGAVLVLMGLGIFLLKGKETSKEKIVQRESFFASFKRLLQFPKMKVYFIANFFLAMGHYFFFRFVTVYLERVYHFTTSQLGFLLAYNSLAFAVAIIILIPYFEKRLSPQGNTALFSLLLGVSCILFIFPKSPWNLAWTLVLVSFFLALAITYGAVLVSVVVDESFQGQAMGALFSSQMLAQVMTSGSGGFLAAILPSLPLIVGGVMCFMATAILFSQREKKGRTRVSNQRINDE